MGVWYVSIYASRARGLNELSDYVITKTRYRFFFVQLFFNRKEKNRVIRYTTYFPNTMHRFPFTETLINICMHIPLQPQRLDRVQTSARARKISSAYMRLFTIPAMRAFIYSAREFYIFPTACAAASLPASKKSSPRGAIPYRTMYSRGGRLVQ